MRRSPLITSTHIAVCAALTTLLTLAFVEGGRDNLVRRGRAGAHRFDAADAVCHEYDAPDPVVAAAAASSDPGVTVAQRLRSAVAVAVVAQPATPTLVDSDPPRRSPIRVLSCLTREASGRAPPAV